MSGNAEHMRAIAQRGGLATKAKYGPDHYREVGAMGGAAGKGKRKKKTPKRVVTDAPAVAAAPEVAISSLDAIIANLEAPRGK